MEKKSSRLSAGLAFSAPDGGARRQVAASPRRDAWLARALTLPIASPRTDRTQLDESPGADVQTQFQALEHHVFSVREIASCLDDESRRLSRLYQRLVLQGDPGGRLGSAGMDAVVVAPLIGHLARGVQVADIHKVLNVAREPLFDEPAPVRGRTMPIAFRLERAVALYLIWRLGHSFHLVPAIRRGIARQLTAELLREMINGRELGLAVTPFIATIGDLEGLLAASYAEVVAFSLNGLVAHALHAFHPVEPEAVS